MSGYVLVAVVHRKPYQRKLVTRSRFTGGMKSSDTRTINYLAAFITLLA